MKPYNFNGGRIPKIKGISISRVLISFLQSKYNNEIPVMRNAQSMPMLPVNSNCVLLKTIPAKNPSDR